MGDIADIVGGGTPSTGNQSYWDGDIDWYAPAEIADQIYANSSQKKITGLGYENSSAKMLPPGTVLFTSRAGIGKTAILTRKGCTNQGFQSIVPHRGELDSYFIFSRTGELKRYGELVGAGSTFVEVSGKQMAVMELMMPPTMREQQTIGGFFQQLDHLITLHQREFAFLCKEKSKKFRYIKNAWEQRKVREVTDRYDNLRIPVAASLRVAGTTPYYGANGIQDYVDGYTHDGEFILVAEDGANDLKNYPVKCVKGRIWVNNHAHVLQGKYDCADNQFLAYAISQADIESLLVGGGRAKLNAETLMGIDLLLPNKAEQIRIGKYLAQLDNLITLHQRKYDKLTNVKKSMLEKMFPQNGSNAPEIRFKGFTEAWEQRKFSDLVQIERGGSPRPIDDFITDSPDGLNWVKIGDAPAQGNYITKTAEKIKPEGLSKTREVHPGDLILSNSMSFGKPYIMGIDGCIHDGWLLIRNTYKVFDLTFLCHLLGTPQMIIQYKSLAAGSTVNNLNKELVGNTVVTIPTIKEQRVLGQYLETLDNLITLHQRKPVVVNSSSTMNALPNQHLYFQVLE